MFATQHYVDVMSDPARKRGRDGEEDAGNASMGFGEHRNKRIQCLPLRAFPKPAQQWHPSSITPLNSDSDEHISASHCSPWPAVSSQPPPHGAELDMMDASFHPEGHNQTGRMPTPVHPQCDWAGPGPAVTTMTGVVNMGHHPSGFSDDQCVPRAMSGAADWQAVQNNRRPPSPISEAGYSAPAQAVDSPAMMIDDNNIPMTLEERPAHAVDHSNAMMDVESSHLHAPELDGDASSPSPARRGHTRSKHTINNWTWQPGMKKSFSIGYRADCEKCRLKVPGHFNHIIIS